MNIKSRGFSRRQMLASTMAGFGAAAVGIRFSDPARAAEEPKVNFYNWDTYIGETTLEDYENESGITVNFSMFADNDEVFAKLKEGNPGFDVVVPSGINVSRMGQAGMLMPIDYSKIPNSANISPLFRDAAFDPGRKYSITYMWGTSAIAYRKSRVDGVPTWKDLFDSDRYSGKISLFGDSFQLHTVCNYLGHGMNPLNPDHINEAADLIIKQKPHIKVFHEDNGQDLLLSGEVDLVIEYNGDIAQAQLEDDDIDYVIPDIGGEIWQDNLVIPTGAPHPDNAHAFINYLLDAKVGADIADYIQYATPNAAARELMSDEYKNNPIIFPEDRLLEACQPVIYQGEELRAVYEEAWTRVQVA